MVHGTQFALEQQKANNNIGYKNKDAFTKKVKVEIGLLQPCVATATVRADKITTNEVSQAYNMIVRHHPGTSNWNPPNLSSIHPDPVVRLKGRMSMAILQKLRDSGKSVPYSPPTFVNMSGSCLNVLLQVDDIVYLCGITQETLRVFPSEREDASGKVMSEQHNLRFKFPEKYGLKDTYFRIDSAGVIGLLGKTEASEQMLARNPIYAVRSYE
ncbi:hypothetical protein DFJ73DRAFT_765707 [Zopfochytrium polystomum]|nr:hypothetical protein DFJ73DRAFT_765707 [Zopfochytrium polystomum]